MGALLAGVGGAALLPTPLALVALALPLAAVPLTLRAADWAGMAAPDLTVRLACALLPAGIAMACSAAGLTALAGPLLVGAGLLSLR
ncbi:hypothetical protein [Deinococcus maricopensis]|uniref:Membrane protein n=1 Tax=Deinococcus maricopensis (strain DSM 21211 / LMG 22137 / NRRL B-23946 / LB-34) TaxID=709986 RepID=E8UB60_DEIML|nr:hypothetical protein [Deinococcus maricopensis]ADV68299.1 membrane protein [Deinococcus maricopensis DSM 21211]